MGNVEERRIGGYTRLPRPELIIPDDLAVIAKRLKGLQIERGKAGAAMEEHHRGARSCTRDFIPDLSAWHRERLLTHWNQLRWCRGLLGTRGHGDQEEDGGGASHRGILTRKGSRSP